MSTLDELRTHWREHRSNDVTLEQLEQRIADLELKYEVRLPEEFRAYLLWSCPTYENWDDELTTWWPVDSIKNIPDEYEYPIENAEIDQEKDVYLFFADYSIWCWAWAINCGDGPNRGRVVVVGQPDRFVADSFGQFIERIIKDWSSVSPS